MSKHSLALPWVVGATRNFSQARKMQEAMSLMLISGLGMIWHGEGGFAKSAFTRRVMEVISDMPQIVVDGHPEMTVDEIFGGIDLNALEEQGNRRIIRDLHRSWVKHVFALFEEGLDIPLAVLAAMKKTIADEVYEQGTQVETMTNVYRMILTNVHPQEVVRMYEEQKQNSVQAFIDRFPIQLNVDWEDRGADAFMDMFMALETETTEIFVEYREIETMRLAAQSVRVANSILWHIAQFAKTYKWSGRTAVYAKRIVQSAAVINGRNYATVEDLRALRYLAGMEMIGSEIEEIIQNTPNLDSMEVVEDAYRVLDIISKYQMNQLLAGLISRLGDELDELVGDNLQVKSAKVEIQQFINGILADYDGDIAVIREDILMTNWNIERIAA